MEPTGSPENEREEDFSSPDAPRGTGGSKYSVLSLLLHPSFGMNSQPH